MQPAVKFDISKRIGWIMIHACRRLIMKLNCTDNRQWRKYRPKR